MAVSSSSCLRQFPASRPLPLPMGPDAALWEIPSGVCCLSPPSRHPQWRRCVRINGKSLHKYLKKGKRKKNKRTAPKLQAFLRIAANRWGTQVLNVHQSVAQSQHSSQGRASSGAASTQGPLSSPRGGERTDLPRPSMEARAPAQVPACPLSIMHNCAFKLNCLGTLLQAEQRLKWLLGASLGEG